MLDPLVLDSEQERISDEISVNKSGGYLLASDPGTGKSAIGVASAMKRGAKTILLIAPAQTKGKPLTDTAVDHEGWWGTFDRQRSGMRFVQIDSSDMGKQALADLQWGVPGVYFVTQQLFALWGWQDDPVKVVKKTGKPLKVRTTTWDLEVDLIIYDEVHRASNGQSQTAKTLMGGGVKNNIGNPKGFMIGASGTYEGNSFDGAWSVTRCLWPQIIPANIYVWRAQWAELEYDHFAVRNQKVVGEKNPGAFVASLPGYARVEANFNIPVKRKTFEVELYPEQRRIYNEFIRQMVAWIGDHPLVTKFPITKATRQRQVSLGVPKLTLVTNKKTGEQEYDVDFDNECESAHIDTMLSEITPVDGFFDGESALIYTDSQKFARVLVYRLNKEYGEGSAREWSGKVSRKQRDLDKQDFLDGKYKYFVAVIKAAGTGTDLLQRVCRNILYVSLDSSRIENKQSNDRIERRGFFSDFMRVAHLIAKNTKDTEQFLRQQEQALAANKRMKARKR